jgi:hypothetical protein
MKGGEMEEESSGPQRSGYPERIKSVIEAGLSQGVHVSQITAEGRLVIMEHFSNDLDQARERVKFLEILLLYAQAKDERDSVGVKPGLFARRKETELGKALGDIELELISAKSEVRSQELEARRSERRTARMQR